MQTPRRAALEPTNSYLQDVIFGGEKGALAAPPGAGPGMPVDAAKKLEKSGVAAPEIFNQTGWYHAPDGQWKWTLSDKGAELNKSEFLMYTDSGGKEGVALRSSNYPRFLDQILTHPTLYQTYPHLKTANVDRMPDAEAVKGAVADYDPETNSVRIADMRPKEAVMSSLLHELQHGVQKYEGFGQGGSAQLFYPPDVRAGKRPLTGAEDDQAYDQYRRLAGETEARQVQKQFNTQNWNELPTRMEGFAPADQQIVRRDSVTNMGPGKSYQFIPVDHDPFENMPQQQATRPSPQIKFVPVDHDPFALPAQAIGDPSLFRRPPLITGTGSPQPPRPDGYETGSQQPSSPVEYETGMSPEIMSAPSSAPVRAESPSSGAMFDRPLIEGLDVQGSYTSGAQQGQSGLSVSPPMYRYRVPF